LTLSPLDIIHNQSQSSYLVAHITIMTNTNTPLRSMILRGLQQAAVGSIEQARLNIEVYLTHPVGIGEHADIMSAIQSQLDIIASQQERIDIINQYFITSDNSQSNK